MALEGCALKTEYILNESMERVLGILTPSNRLVMRVALHTGLRVGDILQLQPHQLRRQFYVTEQKTGKRRRVNLTDDLIQELLAHSGKTWVFPHRLDPARHRTRQAVWADVKRAAVAYRLPANVAPHTARKMYAVDLLERYGDIERVRRALNHSSSSVTVLYACADKLVRQGRRKKGRSW